jgi:hypothetical protein
MNLPTFAAALAMGTLAWAGGSTTSPTSAVARKSPPAAVKRTSVTPAVANKPVTAVAKKPVTAVANKPVTAVAKKPGTAAKRAATKAPVVRTSWRNRQSAPTSDRYREIQVALADRGYLSPEEANGAWGSSSTDALKKFQVEQSLESTGRIDSLSLIALGLGPRYDSSVPRVVDGNVQPESGRNY